MEKEYYGNDIFALSCLTGSGMVQLYGNGVKEISYWLRVVINLPGTPAYD